MVVLPGLERELALVAQGYRVIAGVDEVGRGAWAGPLVAAAVVLPVRAASATELLEQLAGVRDSKTVTGPRRAKLLTLIEAVAVGIGVGAVTAAELDQIGLSAANRLAWRRAIGGLPEVPGYLLLDGFRLPDTGLPQEGIVRGDRDCLSIAAASIVAKVTRDRLLTDLAATFPHYGFERHKGYGTAEHQATLVQYGPCREHRHSFAPIQAVLAAEAGSADG